MKAAIWTAYGGPEVLQLGEVPTPAPKAGEALIKVRATTVMMGDCRLRALGVPLWARVPLRLYAGVIRPSRVMILGQELAGEVEAVGEGVTKFKAGDAVFAPAMFRMGAYAQYACLPASYLQIKPAGISFAEAATIPTGGAYAALQLRLAQVQPGQHVAISGAGGSIGTYAVQIAKAQGAEVTAVDSAEKLVMLRDIGADHVVDFRQHDFTNMGKAYDAIIDVEGKCSFSRSMQSLTPNGRFVLGNLSPVAMLRGRRMSRHSGKQVLFGQTAHTDQNYALILSLIEAGKVKPVIDQYYPLEQIAEAHRYVEAGHKKGNVVITVEHND